MLKILKIAKFYAKQSGTALRSLAGGGVGEGGFGLIGIIVGLVLISIMVAAAMPLLEGYFKLGQAKAAINTANAIINAENQYQMASYSNYAEKGKAPLNNDYFGTEAQLISGMDILPSNNRQYFLQQGASLSLTNYNGNDNCIEKAVGGALIAECLNDENEGQYELDVYGLNSSVLKAYIPMFENGIKGGAPSYNNGVLSVPVSVPFAFSAYPKTQQNSGGNQNNNTAANNGAAIQEAAAQAAASARQASLEAVDRAAWNNVIYNYNPGQQGYNAAVNYAESLSAQICGGWNIQC